MSILTDKEIIELCTPPSFAITTNVPVPPTSGSMVFRYPRPVESYTRRTAAEIEKQINDNLLTHGYHQDPKRATGMVSYRTLTGEEISTFKPMISPFIDHQVKTRRRTATPDEKAIWDANYHQGTLPKNYHMGVMNDVVVDERILSFGLSSAGYDVCLKEDFRIFTNINTTVIDPLAFDDRCLHVHKGPYAIIPPNSYMLGTTVEWFNIPADVLVVVVGKSSLARCGLAITATPIEPGFSGNVVIEVANLSPSPVKVYANMGIAQFLFFRSNEPCGVSYADMGGKYQNQTGVQLAIV